MNTNNINKILIPIDFSETSLRAIKHGVTIAKAFKSELIFLHVQKRGDLINTILPALKIRDTLVITNFLENKLEKLAKKVSKEHHIKVTAMVSIGNIAYQISNIAEEYNIDLIIMGTQGIDSSNDFFLGSNSYRVITKSNVPVMTVLSEVENPKYLNILLAIDSSENSKEKINSAISLAEKFAAHFYVFGWVSEYEESYEYKFNLIVPQIRQLAEAKRVAFSVEIQKGGNRAEKTLEYAQKIKADLIIIVSDEKAGLSSLILGTYAHQLLNHSPIPVLSIPSETNSKNTSPLVLNTVDKSRTF